MEYQDSTTHESKKESISCVDDLRIEEEGTCTELISTLNPEKDIDKPNLIETKSLSSTMNDSERFMARNPFASFSASNAFCSMIKSKYKQDNTSQEQESSVPFDYDETLIDQSKENLVKANYSKNEAKRIHKTSIQCANKVEGLFSVSMKRKFHDENAAIDNNKKRTATPRAGENHKGNPFARFGHTKTKKYDNL